MNRIKLIRSEEKEYHDYFFNNFRLFEEGSWLSKPVQPVMDAFERFKDYGHLKILDLGCGAGRNCIPIAESLKHRDGKVVCVDLLDSAVDKLREYAEEYNVLEYLEIIKSDIENFDITENKYDFIVGVSTLEHLRSVEVLKKKLIEMIKGTKQNGSHCLIFNTNIKEQDRESGAFLDPMFEINLSTDEMLEILNDIYKGWKIESTKILHGNFPIVRNDRPVDLISDCLIYIANKI